MTKYSDTMYKEDKLSNTVSKVNQKLDGEF